jgi:hypothetical protein
VQEIKGIFNIFEITAPSLWTVISRTKEEFEEERKRKHNSVLCNSFSHMSSVLPDE